MKLRNIVLILPTLSLASACDNAADRDTEAAGTGTTSGGTTGMEPVTTAPSTMTDPAGNDDGSTSTGPDASDASSSTDDAAESSGSGGDVSGLEPGGQFHLTIDQGIRYGYAEFWSDVTPGAGVPAFPGESEDQPVSRDKFFIGAVPYGPYTFEYVDVGPSTSATAGDKQFDLEALRDSGIYEFFVEEESDLPLDVPISASYLIPAFEDQVEEQWADALSLTPGIVETEAATIPFGQDLPITWSGGEDTLVTIDIFYAWMGEDGFEIIPTCQGYLVNDGSFDVPAECLPEDSENLIGLAVDIVFGAKTDVEFNERRLNLGLSYVTGLRIDAVMANPQSEPEALMPQTANTGNKLTKSTRRWHR